MANDYLKITQTNRPQPGNQAISLANQLRDVRDKADALNDMAGRMHDGVTFTTVEANFGLPAGTGGNFVTLLQQLQDILNGTTEVTGANRLARLDEFVSRLAGQ
jgi:hypothetical protein